MDKLEFSIASEIGNIVKVENFIDYFSDVYNVEPDVFGKISLCVIEKDAGRGLYLMKTLSDDLIFEDGGSKVTMVFNL